VNSVIKAKDMDVVILCGGRGERLGALLKGRPKPMIEMNGRPFLDILVNYVARFGFKRIILSIGYRGDRIKKHYQKGGTSLTVLFSEEKKPLGTAGAIKKAQSLIKGSFFLVMNGDSFCPIDLNEFIDFHIKKRGLCSIVLSHVQSSDDYGKVALGRSGRVIAFSEKKKSGPSGHLVSAGIYLLNKPIFAEIPKNKQCSMENEIFPKIVDRRFYGFVTKEQFIDIGTPERFQQASLPGKLNSGCFS
jgi:D-glycero-alpha-D-manno-heptose 1-phosphate guanylyltransferase